MYCCTFKEAFFFPLLKSATLVWLQRAHYWHNYYLSCCCSKENLLEKSPNLQTFIFSYCTCAVSTACPASHATVPPLLLEKAFLQALYTFHMRKPKLQKSTPLKIFVRPAHTCLQLPLNNFILYESTTKQKSIFQAY